MSSYIVPQVKISDLSCVDINWRMLTLARPENKIDEEIFSKCDKNHHYLFLKPSEQLRMLSNVTCYRQITMTVMSIVRNVNVLQAA